LKKIKHWLLYDDAIRVPLLGLMIEYALMLVSGVGYADLGKTHFFTLGADPFYWLLFITPIPNVILQDQTLAIILQYLPLLLILFLLMDKNRKWIAFFLFLLMLIYYMILTAVIGHHNFQTGIFLVTIPYIFGKKNRLFIWGLLRYWILFFYVTAAFFKITNPSFFNIHHLANQIITQFLPYNLENQTGFRILFNQWLIEHYQISTGLYLIGFSIEAFCLVGFFTTKYDKIIGLLLIMLHLCIWLVMDIAPIGQISLFIFLIIIDYPWVIDNRNHCD